MPYWVSSSGTALTGTSGTIIQTGGSGTTGSVTTLTSSRPSTWRTITPSATTPTWYEHAIRNTITTRGWYEQYEQTWPDSSAYDNHPDNGQRVYAPPPPTDQQLYEKAVREHDVQEAARIQTRIDARRAADEERQRLVIEERAQLELAKTRARELLLQHLTPTQRETFTRNNWFIVEGGRTKTKYKIHGEHVTVNIDVLGNLDNRIHRLCGHVPMHKVPLSDNLLAQKLMLEYDEDAFLRLANRHS